MQRRRCRKASSLNNQPETPRIARCVTGAPNARHQHFQPIEKSNGYVFGQALPVVDFQLTAGPEEQTSIARMHFRRVVGHDFNWTTIDESQSGTWTNGVNLVPPAIQQRYFKQGK